MQSDGQSGTVSQFLIKLNTHLPYNPLYMVTKAIPKKKKWKKLKWLSEEALQTAEERREVKGKGEKERYTQSKAGFQRVVSRGKQALNEQWKQQRKTIEKTRDLFNKTGDIKGTFHARMTTIKDRNDKDLTEAEEMKWQEYTEPYKKVLITQVNVVTHLDLDTLVRSQVGFRKHYCKQS